jgi:DNA-binding CsgD family transcriptional regulator
VRVLEELAIGTSTDDIAGKLHVSPHTVRTHIKNILRKLDARTRAHAVAIAFAEDAISPDIPADS